MAQQAYVKYTAAAAYTDGDAGTGAWVQNQIKVVNSNAASILPSRGVFTLIGDAPDTGDLAFAQGFVIGAAAAGTTPTLTAALILGGVVTHTAQTAAVTMTTDTAAILYAALPAYLQSNITNASAPVQMRVRIINNNTSSGVITLTAGTGVTITGTATVAVSGVWREYILSFQSATACTFTNIGSGAA